MSTPPRACCLRQEMENSRLMDENQRLRDQIEYLMATNTILVDSVARLSRVASPRPASVASLTACSQRLLDLDLNSGPASASASAPASAALSLASLPVTSRAASVCSDSGVNRKRKDSRPSKIPAIVTLSPDKKKKKVVKSKAVVESSSDSDYQPEETATSKKTKTSATPASKSVTPTADKEKERRPQQCLACGLLDASRNIPRHFKQLHSKSFGGPRWILTSKPFDSCPESKRPSIDMLKEWTGVKWEWIGLPAPEDNEDDADDDGDDDDDDDDSGAEPENRRVAYMAKRLPVQDQLQRLYAPAAKRAADAAQ